VCPTEEVVPELGRTGGRIGRVEDVACDQQSVDGLSFQRIKKPVEKDTVLVLALDPMEDMPKVPVARVENTQGHRAASYGGDQGGVRHRMESIAGRRHADRG